MKLDKLRNRAGMAPRSLDPAESATPAPGKSLAERAQTASLVLVVLGALAALISVFGGDLLPSAAREMVNLLHAVLFGLGGVGGYLAIRRTRDIDMERWQVVADETLTAGERQWAHKEADSNKASAVRTLLLGPLAIGAALAYQLRVPEAVTWSDLLIVTPMLGFGIGALLAHRRIAPATQDPGAGG